MKRKENILFTGPSQQELELSFLQSLENENFYDAMSVFEKIENVKPELYLHLAGMYSKLGEISLEVNNLLKIVGFTTFNKYNFKSVLYRLNLFFFVYNGLDVFEHYKNMLAPRFLYCEDILALKNPVKKKAEEHNGLKLVKENSEDCFLRAMKLLEKDDHQGAINELQTIKKNDSNYAKAQNLIATINVYLGEDDEKTLESIESAVSATMNNPELCERLYGSIRNNEEYKKIATEKILNAEYDLEDPEALTLKAIILYDNGEYEKAINLLLHIKGTDCFSSRYLKLLANCYYMLGERKKLEYVLKRYIKIYPSDAVVRFALSQLLLGKSVNFNEIVNLKIKPSTQKKMIEVVVNCLKNDNLIKERNISEANYIFNLALMVRDNDIINSVANYYIGAGFIDIIKDALINVTTDHIARQLIFQAVIEQKYELPLWVLIDGKMEEFLLNLPKIFKEENKNKDKSKLQFLLIIYAQVLSLFKFSGISLENFYSKQNKLFELLYEKNMEENSLMLNANNWVYAISVTLSESNPEIIESFAYIKDLDKEEIMKEFLCVLSKI